MSDPSSLQPDYFERLYRVDPDPWRFATSDYERSKYEHTLEALPRPRFGSGFEIGCSIGVLTAQLAKRCDRLLAIDVSKTALDKARQRNAAARHVEFDRVQVPGEWPNRTFDLLLFSEVLYYLSLTDLTLAAARTLGSLEPNATVVLVHYTDSTNYPLTGDEAAERFIAACAPRLRPDRQERRAQYRLDRLVPH